LRNSDAIVVEDNKKRDFYEKKSLFCIMAPVSTFIQFFVANSDRQAPLLAGLLATITG